MRRIIEEELKDGSIQYRVESNRMFFGLIPCKWYTCTVTIPYGYAEVSCDAVFNTLEEAQIFVGINPNPVIKRTILEYNTDTSAGHPVKDDDIVRYSFEKRRVKDKEP